MILMDCRSEVGGLIQVIGLEDNCLLVCNDEGKLNGMKPNRWFLDDIICGPFLFVAIVWRAILFL